MLQGAFTAMERIFGILSEDDRVTGDQVISNMKGHVEFKNVSFRYQKRTPQGIEYGPQVLNQLSFDLKPGTSLALVGPTGSGKTTVIKLLSKLYDNFEGEILIDGRSIVDLEPSWLRQQISFVPQDIVLFDGSIAFNIGLDTYYMF